MAARFRRTTCRRKTRFLQQERCIELCPNETHATSKKYSEIILQGNTEPCSFVRSFVRSRSFPACLSLSCFQPSKRRVRPSSRQGAILCIRRTQAEIRPCHALLNIQLELAIATRRRRRRWQGAQTIQNHLLLHFTIGRPNFVIDTIFV